MDLIANYLKNKQEAQEIIENMQEVCGSLQDFIGDTDPLAQQLVVTSLRILLGQVDALRLINMSLVMTQGTPEFKEKEN